MLRWARRRLQLIRYYSASKEHTAWSRAADITLVVAFLAAFPVTWFFDRAMVRYDRAYHVAGIIRKVDEGSLVARVSNPALSSPYADIPLPERLAYFRVDVERMERGFPLITTEAVRLPIMSFRDYREVDAVSAEQAAPGGEAYDAVRAAIAQGEREDERAIDALWRAGRVREQPRPFSWVASFALWWIALFVAASLLVFFTRFVSILAMRNRAARYHMRIARGRCPHCDYDLRGIEFSERCPECGELQE